MNTRNGPCCGGEKVRCREYPQGGRRDTEIYAALVYMSSRPATETWERHSGRGRPESAAEYQESRKTQRTTVDFRWRKLYEMKSDCYREGDQQSVLYELEIIDSQSDPLGSRGEWEYSNLYTPLQHSVLIECEAILLLNLAS